MAVDITVERSSATARRTVRVDLGARGYDIVIGAGLLGQAGTRIAALLPTSKWAVVTDETVAGLHLDDLVAGLAGHGVHAGTEILPAGEATKSFSALEPLCERLLALDIERGDGVIALGGGVIGDLVGFAASILRRGVHLVQVPTTLLAQVDSSVGGKTGINSPQGKNLIGTFYQPSLVLADMDTLETLPPREFRAGYAEVAKYGLLGDAEFFAWLEDARAALFDGDADARMTAIEKSCIAKAEIVAADEREAGRRALLNLGHTFGHALEGFAGYSATLLHGEAVAIGMALAFEFSEELGLCPAADRERAVAHLTGAGLPVRIADMDGPRPTPEALLKLIAQDKKVQTGKPAFILVRGIGAAFVERDVPMDALTDFLTRKCDGQ